MSSARNGLRVVIPIAVLCGGGTEVQTLSLVRALIKAGHETEVVCFYNSYSEVVDRFRQVGCQVTLLNCSPTLGGVLLLGKLHRVFRARKPNVVHLQYIRHGLLTIIAALMAGVEFRFATVHQTADAYGKGPRILMRISRHLATTVFCVSRQAELSWFGAAPTNAGENYSLLHKNYTIYNSVDIVFIRGCMKLANPVALRSRYSTGSGKCLASIGRISVGKGTDVLLRAFKSLVNEMPSLRLFLIGEDLEGFNIFEKICELDLQASVICTGRLPPTEVYQLLSIIDLVVVPSRYEGFCLSAAEAMAAGLPVVGSNVGGLPEVVEDGQTGFLLPYGDDLGLRRCMRQILTNGELADAMGRAGLLRANRRFSVETFDSAIGRLYGLVESCLRRFECVNLQKKGL